MTDQRERPAAGCRACGGGSVRFWRFARASDTSLAQHTAYRLEHCLDCGTASLVDAEPEAPRSLYDAGTYARPAPALDALIEPLRRLLRRERMRFLPPPERGRRVFEVGAGDGRFVEALAQRGYEAAGNEPYRSARANGSAAAVAAVPLEELELEPGSQDAVVLWHVLEHLDEPGGALRRIHGWLAPSGALVVAVPNLSSLQARIGGDRWFHQDVPRHRTQFTRTGAVRLLERSGFRVESVHSLLLDQNLLGMWQTLLNRVTRERDVFYRLVKRAGGTSLRDTAVVALAGPAVLPVAALLELGASAVGRGGSIVLRCTPIES
jgi:predicted SAM-dependent methyltransferase